MDLWFDGEAPSAGPLADFVDQARAEALRRQLADLNPGQTTTWSLLGSQMIEATARRAKATGFARSYEPVRRLGGKSRWIVPFVARNAVAVCL
jgi:hypothetical protein